METETDAARQRRQAFYTSWLVTGGLLAALAHSNGQREAWPFVYWKMYASDMAAPVRSLSWHQIRALDQEGRTHVLWPKDVFTLDDDSSAQVPGIHLVSAAASGSKESQRHLRLAIERVLGRPIRSLTISRVDWRIDPLTYPAFDRDRPDSRTTIARIAW